MRKQLIAFLMTLVVGTTAHFPFANPVAAQSDWAAFWTKFKIAVAKDDKQTVLDLSVAENLSKNYQSLFGAKFTKQCFAKAKLLKDEQGGYSVFRGEQGYFLKNKRAI